MLTNDPYNLLLSIKTLLLSIKTLVLGIEPPDRFPLVFYRDGCADIALTIDDVNAAPLTDTKALLISGTGLSRDPSRSATLYAVERAREAGAEILLDVDPDHLTFRR